MQVQFISIVARNFLCLHYGLQERHDISQCYGTMDVMGLTT